MGNTSKRGQAPVSPQPEEMLAFNRGVVDAYGRMFGACLEAWSRCGRELADFAASRLQKDTALGESLSRCRTWNETAEVQSEWLRTTIDDYARETGRVMEIMSGAAAGKEQDRSEGETAPPTG